ncbi:MAG: hypothetical protein US42_C0001G0093 [Candidatus Magasanikbacteria bacterium GW2011_GWC2_37_14]|uniref:tRNA threonylcarbamoyladenosine biosynthesis protein TsaE n=1 Tax=Candidatus Magasanikbacteria bacterium GW2011_GWC2_37_14 TaxID=1619046 RepID=A0A0G0GE36_9BACT|nr:MAG: hypothetical protein US42_C0001G0093 [Candidatus Magasanikbacteria bacterium GW2011_GWC2_37_14]
MEYFTHSEKDLITLGKKLAANFKAGDVVLLSGNLGAGKTTFTKGVAQYFGIKKNITSPTFSLMNVYPVKSAGGRALKGQFNRVNQLGTNNLEIRTLVHIDTYRLENEEKLLEIGAEDYLGSTDTVCLIEWPEKLKKLLKNKKIVKINIEHLDAGRKVIIND